MRYISFYMYLQYVHIHTQFDMCMRAFVSVYECMHVQHMYAHSAISLSLFLSLSLSLSPLSVSLSLLPPSLPP